MKVYLISENEIKGASVLADNCDGTYLNSAIETAQLQHLMPLLGTQLYNRICNDITNGTLNEDYKFLLDDYIQPFMIQQVLSDIIIPLSYKLRNAGTVQNSDDRMNQSSKSEIDYLQQFYADKAAFFANRLFDFLIQEKSTYKEFCTCKKYADMHSNLNAGYRTGIYLGK